MESPAGPERAEVDVMMSEDYFTQKHNESETEEDVEVVEEEATDDEFFFWP